MTARLALLAASAALVIGVLAIACGNRGGGDSNGAGEELSLTEYFQQLGELDAVKDKRLAELEQTAAAGLAAAQSTEDAIRVLQEQFPGSMEATKAFVDGMAALRPPEVARDAHNNAVEKGRKAIAALEDAAEKIRNAKTEDDLEVALSADFVTASDDFERTCVDLRDIADEYGIDTDLDCE